MISTHIDHIYNDFLLQRTLVKRLRIEPDELIKVSRSLLSSILVLVGNRDRMGSYACDLPWDVCCSLSPAVTYQDFGLMVLIQDRAHRVPSAGVLPLELLQNIRTRTQAKQDFPHSKIIQNLSALVCCMDWIVRPTDGNYVVCSQAKKMIQAILDIVLSPDSATAATDEHASNTTSSILFGSGLEDQLWFDNSGFDMDFWMNLEEHPLLAWPEVT